MNDSIHLLDNAVEVALRAYHRLVILVGEHGTGKSSVLRAFADRHGCTPLNVNLELAQRLLGLSKVQRARQADDLFQQLLSGSEGSVVVLDNCELLFDQSLQLDPLRLLQAASRNRTVVASWCGTLEDGVLTYAEPRHPEYRTYTGVDAVLVPVEQVTGKRLTREER